MGMFKKVAKAVGKMGVLPKAIKETKVGKINPNLVGKPKPGVAPVGGKRSLPPMPTKVPAKGKPTSPGKTVMNSNKTPEQMKVIRARMGVK
jgi:hypothetical protein